MAGFTLERLLELKRFQEEARAAELAEARGAEEAARQGEAALADLRRAAADRTASTAKVLVGQLRNTSLVVENLDRQLEAARATVKAAQREVKVRMADFTEALQERRVLDRLKEKKLEEQLAEEIRLDQTVMDSIALTRFGRKENNEGKGET